MNNRIRISLVVFATTTTLGTNANSHPSVPGNEHPHNTSNIGWEIDNIKDGEESHNHAGFLPFWGGGTTLNPSSMNACWDNATVRVDASGAFYPKGHCYINGVIPEYYFDDQSSWPAGAKNVIRSAFAAWSAIELIDPGTFVGLEFDETSDESDAEIVIKWGDIDDSSGGGETFLAEEQSPIISEEIVTFDSDLAGSTYPWSFELLKSNVPASKWHFYSVALHEVGHVVGLAHQTDSNDLMTPGVGQPAASNGRQFNQIDDDSADMAARLYSQPPQPPPSSCSISWSFNGCYSPQAYTFTAYLPGYTVTHMDVDYQNGTSGPWYSLFSGVFTCPGYSSQTIRTVRSILTTAYGISQCQTVIYPQSCYDPPD